jgi:hypothetical protein
LKPSFRPFHDGTAWFVVGSRRGLVAVVVEVVVVVDEGRQREENQHDEYSTVMCCRGLSDFKWTCAKKITVAASSLLLTTTLNTSNTKRGSRDVNDDLLGHMYVFFSHFIFLLTKILDNIELLTTMTRRRQ